MDNKWIVEYARLLELEALLPHWERKIAELQEKGEGLREQWLEKREEASQWEESGYFRRLLSGGEKKRDAFWQEIRALQDSMEKNDRELAFLRRELQQGREELETLSGVRERWEASWDSQEKMPADIFAPAVIACVSGAIPVLWEGRKWMREDAIRKGVREENRKMACLEEADFFVSRLRHILTITGEEIPACVRNLKGYVQGPTSEYKQLDRLNNAMERIRAIREEKQKLI